MISSFKPVDGITTVKFENEDIEKDFRVIYNKYELIRQMYSQLSLSDFTYMIRYGSVHDGTEGAFETNGENLFITLKKDGEYSTQVTFVHEATHALQFENGSIGFFQKNESKWEAMNIDIWDEAEAFQASIAVAEGVDLTGCMNNKGVTNLFLFKKEFEVDGFESAVQWLSNVYPKLSSEHKSNPGINPEIMNKFWAKKGYKFYYSPFQPQGAHSD